VSGWTVQNILSVTAKLAA